MTRPSEIELSVSAGGCILGAAAILLLPLELLLSAILAASFHELCHWVALLLCDARIHRFQIGIGGAVIEATPLPPLQEFFCAMAGPVGSFLCLLLIRPFPLFALCGFLQGIYNLLPVYPMDGGRMLLCGLLLINPGRAEKISSTVAAILCVALLGGCIVLYFKTRRVFYPVLGGCFLSSIGRMRKTPCKRLRDWVQ